MFASARSANPAGSKNPTGSSAPGSSDPAWRAVALGVETVEGAKAAAEPAMTAIRAAVNFIVVVLRLL